MMRNIRAMLMDEEGGPITIFCTTAYTGWLAIFASMVVSTVTGILAEPWTTILMALRGTAKETVEIK